MKHAIKLIAVATCFLLTTQLYAQENASAAGSSGEGSVSTPLIAGYSQDYWGPPATGSSHANFYLFTQSPSYDSNLAASVLLSYFMQSSATQAISQQGAATLVGLLSSTATSQVKQLHTALSSLAPISNLQELPYLYQYNVKKMQFIQIKSPIPTNATGPQAAVDAAKLKVLSAQLVKPYDYASLMNKDMYQAPSSNKPSTEAINAQSFINYITGVYNPIPGIDFSVLFKAKAGGSDNTKLMQALQIPEVQKYFVAMRRYVSFVSVALSNFNYLYSQRQALPTNKVIQQGGVIPGFSTAQNLPPQFQKQVSRLALDRWMATRRLVWNKADNGSLKNSWYNKIEQATPATLQRENVLLLAEIRYELFKMRMVQERTLATMSAIELENAKNMKFSITQLISNACSKSPLKGSGACAGITKQEIPNVAPPPTQTNQGLQKM